LVEELSLLGFGAVEQLGKTLPTYRRIVPLSFSEVVSPSMTLHRLIRPQDEGTTVLWHVDNHLHSDMQPHPRRLQSSSPLMAETQLLQSTLILISCSQKLVIWRTFLWFYTKWQGTEPDHKQWLRYDKNLLF